MVSNLMYNSIWVGDINTGRVYYMEKRVNMCTLYRYDCLRCPFCEKNRFNRYKCNYKKVNMGKNVYYGTETGMHET